MEKNMKGMTAQYAAEAASLAGKEDL